MFVARAGLRQLRSGSDYNHPFAYRPKKKKEKEKFRCYIPFMWSTCVAIFTGISILAAGLLMCVIGYFADHNHRQAANNNNATRALNVTEKDETGFNHMRGLTFIGPVLMGFGCFIIVVACVVVCETRDKMLKIIAQAEKQKKKVTTKPDFYDLVIKQFKDKHKATLRRSSKVNHHADGGDSESGAAGRRTCRPNLFQFRRPQSAKSSFNHIGGALKTIPVQIFTIDVERTKETSLQPVAATLSHTLKVNSPGANKFPSTSCIHDLLRDQSRDSGRRPLPARLSWLKRPKTVFADRRPMHRLKPLVPTDPLYQQQQQQQQQSADQENSAPQTADSSVRPAGNNQVCASSNLKNATEIKGEFSSDSETEDRPEGCICLRNSKDYTIVDTSTDASEDRPTTPVSLGNFPRTTDPNRRTLLLHQAAVHGEEGISSQEFSNDEDISSIYSSRSRRSLSNVSYTSTNSNKRRRSADSLRSESSPTSGHGTMRARDTRSLRTASLQSLSNGDSMTRINSSAAGSAVSLNSNNSSCSSSSFSSSSSSYSSSSSSSSLSQRPNSTNKANGIKPLQVTEVAPSGRKPSEPDLKDNEGVSVVNSTTTRIHLNEGSKKTHLQNGDTLKQVAV